MKTYYEPVYKAYIMAFVEPDPIIAKKRCGKFLDYSDLSDVKFDGDAKTIEFVRDDGGQRIVIWLRKPSTKSLVHELVHAVQFTFEKRRIPFNLDSSENIAYYMEHLFEIFEPILTNKRQRR